MIEARVAGAGDLPTIAAMRRAWTEEDHGVPVDDVDFEVRFSRWCTDEGDRRTFFLVAVDGVDVGMANVLRYVRMPTPGRGGGHWGYLGNVYVQEDRRGSGVGAVLLTTVRDWAWTNGYDHLRLAPRAQSIPFYERLGFAFGSVMQLSAPAGAER